MAEFEFTPDQNAAIESQANMVITACPGSGKTSIIVEKIRRSVFTLKSFQGVIAITFTVKASKELKKRCNGDGLNTRSSFFGTIDHFCLSEIIYPFISRLYGNTLYPLECKAYNDLNEELKVGLPNLGQSGQKLNTEDYETYEDILKSLYSLGIILLESLGILSVHIIKKSEGCRKYFKSKYISLYVDEYQDSSQPQHQLFLTLLDLGLSAVAVGDTQQSIYSWRGCDPVYIKELIDKPDVFEHHIVNINHRCHPSITNYANRLFNKDYPLLPTQEIRIYHWVLNGTQLDVAEQLSESIKEILSNNIVSSFSEIAILVRKNKSLEFLKNGLKVPFRVFNDDPLSLINSPVSKVMSGLLVYYFDHQALINDVIDLLSQYRSITRSQLKSVRIIIRTIKECDVASLRQTIVHVAMELLNNEITDAEINALDRVINDKNLLKQFQPADENEVQVMTLHKSKGLEFDIIFHLDLYDWVFPRRVYTGNFNEEVFSDWEQELNLHYVGITRAKKLCILVSSNTRINLNGETKNGVKSQFMNLKGLDGLYK